MKDPDNEFERWTVRQRGAAGDYRFDRRPRPRLRGESGLGWFPLIAFVIWFGSLVGGLWLIIWIVQTLADAIRAS